MVDQVGTGYREAVGQGGIEEVDRVGMEYYIYGN